jgi:hypothetical protein
MRTLLALAFLLAALSVRAQTVPLIWDYPPDYRVGHFNLYVSTNYLYSTALTEPGINTGTNQTCTVTDLAPGRWFFAATAVSVDGIESSLSQVISVEVLPPPIGMRTLSVEHSITLTNLAGWNNVGFFRIKLGNP